MFRFDLISLGLRLLITIKMSDYAFLVNFSVNSLKTDSTKMAGNEGERDATQTGL